MDVLWLVAMEMYLFSAAVSSSDKHCPENWAYFNKKCFFVKETKLRFYEAFEYCQRLNATLASVHSEVENILIKNIAFNERANERELWLGGEQFLTGMPVYKWFDGSRFSYWNWRNTANNSEPNCRSRNGCCAISMDRSGLWYDLPCGHPSLFICQQFLEREKELFKPDNFLMRFLQSRELEKDRSREGGEQQKPPEAHSPSAAAAHNVLLPLFALVALLTICTI